MTSDFSALYCMVTASKKMVTWIIRLLSSFGKFFSLSLELMDSCT